MIFELIANSNFMFYIILLDHLYLIIFLLTKHYIKNYMFMHLYM